MHSERYIFCWWVKNGRDSAHIFVLLRCRDYHRKNGFKTATFCTLGHCSFCKCKCKHSACNISSKPIRICFFFSMLFEKWWWFQGELVCHQNSSIRNSRMTFLRQLLNGKLNPFLLNWIFNDTVARTFWTKRITDESIAPVQIWLLWLSAAHMSLYGDGMQTNPRMFGWSILKCVIYNTRIFPFSNFGIFALINFELSILIKFISKRSI